MGDEESTKKVKTAIEYACGDSKATQFVSWVTKRSKPRNTIDSEIVTKTDRLAEIGKENKLIHLMLCLSVETGIESSEVWEPIVKSSLPSNIVMKTIIFWTEKKNDYEIQRNIEGGLDSEVKKVFNSVKTFQKKQNTSLIFIASTVLAIIFRVRNFRASRK